MIRISSILFPYSLPSLCNLVFSLSCYCVSLEMDDSKGDASVLVADNEQNDNKVIEK